MLRSLVLLLPIIAHSPSPVLAQENANDSRSPYVEYIPQIIDAQTLQKYKNSMPRVSDEHVQMILQDPNTFWYDHATMPPCRPHTKTQFPTPVVVAKIAMVPD